VPGSEKEDEPALAAAMLEVAMPGITRLESTVVGELTVKIFAAGIAAVSDPFPSAPVTEVALTGEVLSFREPRVKSEMPVSRIVEVLVPGTLTVDAVVIGTARADWHPSKEATGKVAMPGIP